jgi:hypothetical protein
VELNDGDQVPADIRVLTANDMKVDNSSLTGESEAQERSPELARDANGKLITVPLEAANLCFFTTIVTAGSARGMVIGTGDRYGTGLKQSMLRGLFLLISVRECAPCRSCPHVGTSLCRPHWFAVQDRHGPDCGPGAREQRRVADAVPKGGGHLHQVHLHPGNHYWCAAAESPIQGRVAVNCTALTTRKERALRQRILFDTLRVVCALPCIAGVTFILIGVFVAKAPVIDMIVFAIGGCYCLACRRAVMLGGCRQR